MYKIKCYCGKSERNFKYNIGKFYNSCCKEEGYNVKGELEVGEEELNQSVDMSQILRQDDDGSVVPENTEEVDLSEMKLDPLKELAKEMGLSEEVQKYRSKDEVRDAIKAHLAESE